MRINRALGQIEKNNSKAGTNVFIIRSQPVNSLIFGDKSTIIESAIEDTYISDSQVVHSSVLKSTLFDAVLAHAFVVNSRIQPGSVIEGRLEDVACGLGVVVGDEATVRGITIPSYAQILRGVWERPPLFIDDDRLTFNVTESTDENILIGCYERPGLKWLKTSQKAFERIGITMEDWILYKEIVVAMMDEKTSNPSPKGFANT